MPYLPTFQRDEKVTTTNLLTIVEDFIAEPLNPLRKRRKVRDRIAISNDVAF